MLEIEELAHQLDGYLHALRRLSDNRCDFWSYTFDLQGDAEATLKTLYSDHGRELIVLGKRAIGYELEALLKESLQSMLTLCDESVIGFFAWDIVELIQMTYRMLQPEIDPLKDRQATCFDLHSEFHGAHIGIVVPVRDRALVVMCAQLTVSGLHICISRSSVQ